MNFVNEKLGFDPSKTYQALNKLFRPFWINSNENSIVLKSMLLMMLLAIK